MKCSPFSKGLKKHCKHHIKFMGLRRMEGCEMSSSSDEEEHGEHFNDRSEDGNYIQNHEKPGHCMKNKTSDRHWPMHGMEHGMKHGMRHGHGMWHGLRHGHGMEHGVRHIFGMRHGHNMGDGRRHGHGMKHGMGQGHWMKNGMGQGHGMKHRMGHGLEHGMRHGMEHGMRHGHGIGHGMTHGHGMKHRMKHCHEKKHRKGHDPDMHHKMRNQMGRFCCRKQSEESSHQVQVENVNESCESRDATLYKPKTSAEILTENGKFQIFLDISNYQPEEVSVKIIESKIYITAVHESMDNDLYEFHEMQRSFDIPESVNPEVMTARLDQDGKLCIEAIINVQDESSPTERDIPVVVCE